MAPDKYGHTDKMEVRFFMKKSNYKKDSMQR